MFLNQASSIPWSLLSSSLRVSRGSEFSGMGRPRLRVSVLNLSFIMASAFAFMRCEKFMGTSFDTHAWRLSTSSRRDSTGSRCFGSSMVLFISRLRGQTTQHSGLIPSTVISSVKRVSCSLVSPVVFDSAKSGDFRFDGIGWVYAVQVLQAEKSGHVLPDGFLHFRGR